MHYIMVGFRIDLNYEWGTRKIERPRNTSSNRLFSKPSLEVQVGERLAKAVCSGRVMWQ